MLLYPVVVGIYVQTLICRIVMDCVRVCACVRSPSMFHDSFMIQSHRVIGN